jgi:hypothetical protein
MPVDAERQIEIDRPRRKVAAYSSDPDNATAWYENIRSVDWKTPRPVAVGSRIVFVAAFLGRRLAYTYEVREMVADERLVMRTAEGPFPEILLETRPAVSRTRTCFDAAASVMSNGIAISVTLRSPARKSSSMLRRIGCASAA